MESRTRGQRVSPGEQHNPGETTDKSGARALSDEQTAAAHGRTPSEPQPDIMVMGGSDAAARMSPVPVVRMGETRRPGSEKRSA